MAQEHDTGYKLLFSHPEMVQDLIRGFVPDEWLHGLDYSTLERVSGSYVTDDFRQREDDVVWRVRVNEEWVYLYLLLEFQSSVDKYMALRMMVYVGLLYQDLIRQGEVPNGGYLPPVLPIVLYNGSSRWSAVTNVADLIPDVPGLLQQFKPHMAYLLVDESQYSDDELATRNNLVAAIFRIESPANIHQIQDVLKALSTWLAHKPALRRSIVLWLRAVFMRRPEYKIALPDVEDLDEVNVMLLDRLDEWAQSFKAEGLQQGMLAGKVLGKEEGKLEGEQRALRSVLEAKFGQLPESVQTQIQHADSERIMTWLVQAVQAVSLDVLFPPTAH